MHIDDFIAAALAEDIGDGDHTSLATIPAHQQGSAVLVAKEEGIVAGIRIAEKVYKAVDAQVVFIALVNDGSPIQEGDKIFRVEGSEISILTAERLALNILQRMSGIATTTYAYVQKIKGTSAKLLDTRKTTPLMRQLEKEAVLLGGGHNHRMGLYDMMMIKDNHIDFAGGIGKAIQAAHDYMQTTQKDLKIEIEVRDMDELQQVLDCGGIHRIMLDNFSPKQLAQAVQIIAGRYETEASGGITIDSLRAYAETGVDYISVGALTHHIKSIDLSLKAQL